MEWVIAVIVVVVIGLAAAMATGALGEMRAEPVRDQYRQSLPAGPLSGQDVHDLRFGVTLRGYSMGQVDEVIDRLSAEIAERDRLLGDRFAREPQDIEEPQHIEEPQTDEPQTDEPQNAEEPPDADETGGPESPEELRG
ncbi:DivIVA domain-containing protein [Propionibacteriaceae bacterium Y1685]